MRRGDAPRYPAKFWVNCALALRSLSIGNKPEFSSGGRVVLARNALQSLPMHSSLGRFRLAGMLEGGSFLLLLFVAMPLKYLADWPVGVRVVGMAHGVLFLLYLLAIVPAAIDHRWSWKRIAGAVVASLLPFGPFVFDAKVLRREEAASIRQDKLA